MKLETLLKIINGNLVQGEKIRKIKNIKIDSRKVKKGDLYIALKGKKNNGHDYIASVLKKKPSFIVVCEDVEIKTKIPIIKVADTYETLVALASYMRKKHNIPLIAVTGSVGKTTTKDLIAHILDSRFEVLKSEKNYNNHIGLPLTLFNLKPNHDICVVELGMNHLNEISKLSKTCRPDVAVITNIGTAHIGNLGSKKNILKAKLEILDGMNGGVLVVNGCDKYLKKVKYDNLIKTNEHLKPFNIDIQDKVSFDLVINDIKYHFSYNSTNISLITNFLLAIEVALIFNIDMETIQEKIKTYKLPKERMQVIYHKQNKIIDDCYNASFETVKASIRALAHEEKQKVIILGDMLELGKYSHKLHKKIEQELKTLKNVTVYLVGKDVKCIKHKKAVYFDNNQELLDYLDKHPIENSVVLVKGSRGMQLEQIVKYLTI